jgi:hypothetical protein
MKKDKMLIKILDQVPKNADHSTLAHEPPDTELGRDIICISVRKPYSSEESDKMPAHDRIIISKACIYKRSTLAKAQNIHSTL